MFGEAGAEFVDFVDGRDGVVRHVVQEEAEALGGELGALEHEGLLLAFVLVRGLGAEVFRAEHRERRVLFEELRQVEIFPAVGSSAGQNPSRGYAPAQSSKSGVTTTTKL
jgi:hypothetical protein